MMNSQQLRCFSNPIIKLYQETDQLVKNYCIYPTFKGIRVRLRYINKEKEY